MARLIKSEKEVEGRYEEVWTLVEEDALVQWPAGPGAVVGRDAPRLDGYEKARGEVQIKDLIEGAKAAAAIASNQEWRETRPAQFSCAETDLVAKVREVLARHDVAWG